MISIFAIGIVFYLFYYLFIEGNGYPILFFIFGVFGGKQLITTYFPSSTATIMTFLSYDVCYATFIAAIISICGIGVLMEKN